MTTRLDHAPVLASIINAVHLAVLVMRGHAKTRRFGPMTDVERVTALDAAVAASGEDFAWRTSIVDLMKLLRLDSSSENRRRLAWELGYAGALDQPEMNIWLHGEVMRAVAERNLLVPT